MTPVLQTFMTAFFAFISSALGVYGVMRYFQGKTEARLESLEDGKEVNASDIKQLELDIKKIINQISENERMIAIVKTEHDMIIHQGEIPHAHRLDDKD